MQHIEAVIKNCITLAIKLHHTGIMENTNLPILCNIAHCNRDCMCVCAASYSTYFPCHHSSAATALIFLATSEQLTAPRAELLSGLSSKLLPLSLHAHTHTIHTWTYTVHTAAHTPVHSPQMHAHSHMHPPSHTLTLRQSQSLRVVQCYILTIAHTHTFTATARQEIWCEMTATQINPPLSCSEWWRQSAPPNRPWWDTTCAWDKPCLHPVKCGKSVQEQTHQNHIKPAERAGVAF